MGETNLKNLVKENREEKHVWVYDVEGKILAVLVFVDFDSYFHIDLVVTNESEQKLCDQVHPGYSLFSLLEDFAIKFGHTRIRLDSIADRVEYWKSHGYVITGIGYNVENLGRIYPMEKTLV
jgi:pyruvate carboxylase